MYSLLLELFAHAMQEYNDFDEPEKTGAKRGRKETLSYYPKKKKNHKVKIKKLLKNKTFTG